MLDDKVSKINWQDETFGEDLRCYIDNLVETPDFKLVFDNVFPLRRASSLVALYTNYGWLSAIGRDPSERDSRYVDVDDPEITDAWREGLFPNSKRTCYRMFHGFYESDSWDWNWDWNWDFNFKLWFSDMLPSMMTTNLDPSVRWWQRWQIETNRPYDKEGESWGNNDRVINKGEAVEVTFTIKNTGNGDASNVIISICLLYTSPSPRDPKTSRMPSSA